MYPSQHFSGIDGVLCCCPQGSMCQLEVRSNQQSSRLAEARSPAEIQVCGGVHRLTRLDILAVACRLLGNLLLQLRARDDLLPALDAGILRQTEKALHCRRPWGGF